MKILINTLLIALIYCNGFSQAKKPTIMVVPSRQWCIGNGYYTQYVNLGRDEKIPDYQKALDENPELLLVISKINSLYIDRGYPLKDLGQTLLSLKQSSAEEIALNLDRQTTNNGLLSESLYDKIRNVAKADIIIEIQWNINHNGPMNSINFIMRGLDAFTDKQIAGAEGTGEPSGAANLPILLQEAVLSHIDNFNTRLQTYFEDLLTNGREIKLEVRKDSGWDKDFDTAFNGEELSAQIENWMSKNTVNGRFTTELATEDKLLFTQVRIPLYDSNQRAIDARSFGRNLMKYLKESPYNLIIKTVSKGLGSVQLICGIK